MKIIIPTKGRLSNQLTLQNLPDSLREITIVVCPQSEAFWHKQNHPLVSVVSQPHPDMGISEKRKWIIETAWADKIVMLDDDLRFAVRRTDDPGLFRKAETSDIIQAFGELEQILSPEVPHAGFSARGGGIGASAQEGGWQEGKRMMYVLGYHTSTVIRNAEFGRIATHEDMDICLQLLSKGFPNKVNHSFVVDQKFGNPGGCTTERTVEGNNLDSLKLAQLHPNYVRVTEKAYKASTPRIEVVCQWGRCLKDGILNRKLREQSI